MQLKPCPPNSYEQPNALCKSSPERTLFGMADSARVYTRRPFYRRSYGPNTVYAVLVPAHSHVPARANPWRSSLLG